MYLYNKIIMCNSYISHIMQKKTGKYYFNLIRNRVPYKENIKDYIGVLKEQNPINKTKEQY